MSKEPATNVSGPSSASRSLIPDDEEVNLEWTHRNSRAALGGGPCLGHRPLPDKRFRNVRRAARAPAGTGPRRPSGGGASCWRSTTWPWTNRRAVRRGYQRRVGQMRQPGAVAALVGLPPRRPVARGGAEAVPDPFRALLRGVHGRGASGRRDLPADIERTPLAGGAGPGACGCRPRTSGRSGPDSSRRCSTAATGRDPSPPAARTRKRPCRYGLRQGAVRFPVGRVTAPVPASGASAPGNSGGRSVRRCPARRASPASRRLLGGASGARGFRIGRILRAPS